MNEIEELKESCHNLIENISDMTLLEHIKRVLEYIIRRVE